MRPAPTWFGVRRHIIDGPFGGGGGLVLDPEPSGGSGKFRGYAYGPGGALFGILVLDRNLWDLSCVFALQAALEECFFFFFFYHDFYR